MSRDDVLSYFTKDRMLLVLVVLVLAKSAVGEPIYSVLKGVTGIDYTEETRLKDAAESGLKAVTDNQNLDFSTRQKITLSRMHDCDLNSIFDFSQSLPGPESPDPLPTPRPRDSMYGVIVTQ